jgi:hypothetical protein
LGEASPQDEDISYPLVILDAKSQKYTSQIAHKLGCGIRARDVERSEGVNSRCEFAPGWIDFVGAMQKAVHAFQRLFWCRVRKERPR